MRTATGCTQDTNIQHLHDETLILPIHDHLQLHASQYKQKTHHPSHPLHKHTTYFNTSRLKNTIFNNGRYTTNIPTDPHTITTTDIKTNLFAIKCSTSIRKVPLGLEVIGNLLPLLRGDDGWQHLFKILLYYSFQNRWDELGNSVFATRNEYISFAYKAPVTIWQRMMIANFYPGFQGFSKMDTVEQIINNCFAKIQ